MTHLGFAQESTLNSYLSNDFQLVTLMENVASPCHSRCQYMFNLKTEECVCKKLWVKG